MEITLFQNGFEYLGGLAAIVGAFLAGVKWMLSRSDKKEAMDREFLIRERERVEAAVKAQVDALIARIEHQDVEIERLRKKLESYIRHTGRLEGLLRSHGQDIPEHPRDHD